MAKEEIKKKKLGAPSGYNPKVPKKLLEYAKKPDWEYIDEERLSPSGIVKTIKVRVPCECPTIEGFCAEIGISKDTFYRWVKQYKPLSDAFKQFKPLQARKLLNHGLNGAYNSAITRLVLANCTDYREQKEEINNSIININVDKDDKDL